MQCGAVLLAIEPHHAVKLWQLTLGIACVAGLRVACDANELLQEGVVLIRSFPDHDLQRSLRRLGGFNFMSCFNLSWFVCCCRVCTCFSIDGFRASLSLRYRLNFGCARITVLQVAVGLLFRSTSHCHLLKYCCVA